jgi:integrase
MATPKPKTRRGSGTMQFLTQEELKHLLAVITNKCDKALFLLAYRHGLRASEIGLLQRMDVDLKQGGITIHRLKVPSRASIPCSPMSSNPCARMSGRVPMRHPTSSSPIAVFLLTGGPCGARCRPMEKRLVSHRRSASSTV